MKVSEIAARISQRLSDRHGVKLREQMALMERQLLPDLEQYAAKGRLLEVVGKAVRECRGIANGGELKAFGSCENGLWTRGSDVDACLVIPGLGARDERELWQSQLKVVGSLMRRIKAQEDLGLGECSMVRGAKVPVLKVADKGGREWLDISVNNVAALDNTALVKRWGELDHRFRPLGRVVKHWASRRKINDRALGTLSTYTLILQIVFIMQRQGILPLHPCEPTGAIAENDSPLTAADLFRDFFEFFGSEQAGEGLEIAEGVSKPSEEGVLAMRCPLTGKNVNPMTRSTWIEIHKEFVRGRDMLRDHRSLFEICTSK